MCFVYYSIHIITILSASYFISLYLSTFSPYSSPPPPSRPPPLPPPQFCSVLPPAPFCSSSSDTSSSPFTFSCRMVLIIIVFINLRLWPSGSFAMPRHEFTMSKWWTVADGWRLAGGQRRLSAGWLARGYLSSKRCISMILLWVYYEFTMSKGWTLTGWRAI